MIILEANQHHEVTLDRNNNVFVTINSENPVSGEIEPVLGFALSPHNALWLAEMIKNKIGEIISPNYRSERKAKVLPLKK